MINFKETHKLLKNILNQVIQSHLNMQLTIAFENNHLFTLLEDLLCDKDAFQNIIIKLFSCTKSKISLTYVFNGVYIYDNGVHINFPGIKIAGK